MSADADDLAARRARLEALLAAIAGRVRPASSILGAEATSAPPREPGAAPAGPRGLSPTLVLAGLALVGGALWARRRGRTADAPERGLLSTFAHAAGDAFGRTLGAAVVSSAGALFAATRTEAAGARADPPPARAEDAG